MNINKTRSCLKQLRVGIGLLLAINAFIGAGRPVSGHYTALRTAGEVILP